MALTTHIALLRAVNVGGRKLLMAELRGWATALGFRNVQTLLQSGNLIFQAADVVADAALEARLEAGAKATFGLAIDFIVRTAAEWDTIVAANPFAEAAEGDPARLVVVALKGAPGADAVAALRAWIPGRETFHAHGRELYITYPDGQGESKLTNVAIERRLGVRGTARNWNTVLKLAAVASNDAP